MTDISLISKLLIKQKLKVLTDSEKLQLEKLKKEYPISTEIKIEELVYRIESYSKINEDKAWKLIEVKIQNKIDKPVFKLFNASWYKYAATVIIILTTAYFLNDIVFKELIIDVPVIVNTSTISSGTDKAIVTLEDGSQITLEKGKEVQIQNANSNGEEIIYAAGKQNSKELVYNYLTIPRGGQFFIKLSDGTQVWLNSESQLKYPVTFLEGQIREVELVYGEAYFDVTPSSENKGSKFRVINKFQEIEVLGTEFNVKAYQDESTIYTTLVEGSVAVRFENIKQNLRPNQQSSFNPNTSAFKITHVDTYNETSWKDGVFSFERKPLKEIMKVLSRWYDMDIVFEDTSLETVKFFGVLDKDQDIEEILKIIKQFKIIESYVIKNKTITLK
jgi:ferric-dicitrate binding protein FerR (iron transport regulator)